MVLQSSLFHSFAPEGLILGPGCVGLPHMGCDSTPSLLVPRDVSLSVRILFSARFQNSGSLLGPVIPSVSLLVCIVEGPGPGKSGNGERGGRGAAEGSRENCRGGGNCRGEGKLQKGREGMQGGGKECREGPKFCYLPF